MEEEEGVGEGGPLHRQMGSRMRGEEAVEEAPQEVRHEPVEGEVGESLGWVGGAVEQTCPAETEEEAEVQRWELWKEVAAAGHLGLGRGEEVGGLSCGVGEGVEDRHLWMEEVEELVSLAHF